MRFRFKYFIIIVSAVVLLSMYSCVKIVKSIDFKPHPTKIVEKQIIVQNPVNYQSNSIQMDLPNIVQQWLNNNSNRNNAMKKLNILPNSGAKIDVIHFQDSDVIKFTADLNQWNQVKVDSNGDGIYDEKWLLKNNKLYKREVLDRLGKTVSFTYF